MKLNIIFHSIHGHCWQLAQSIARGAREIEGVEVGLYRVPETLSEELLEAADPARDREAFAHVPVAGLAALEEADAIVLGAPVYFGAPSAQMFSYLHAAGECWAQGRLVGKIGSCFASAAEQNGGVETSLAHLHTFFYHQGMIAVSVPTPLTMPEMHVDVKPMGGYPYGASTITGGMDDRDPSPEEETIAALQGRTVARTLRELTLGRAQA